MTSKDLQSIQASIKKKGYDWVAEETPLSTLSEQEQKKLLGLAVDEAELEANALAIKALQDLQGFRAAPAAPAAVDWRNNGGNWVTPIKDQASCGSCVAFGTVSTMESAVRIVCRNPNLNIDLSEAHLFYCGCGNCCGSGWNFAPALDFCKNTGVGTEASFPYTPGNQPCKAGVTPYAKISSWASIMTAADRKNALATKGPLVAGMAVYADFFSYRSGVYKVTSNDLRGYHCISVIGYDDSLGCWICKNSWGTAWGDAGFFKIGYGQSMIDTNFSFYSMTVAQCPVPTCARYTPYLRSVLLAARTNAVLRRCLKYYVCGIGTRPLCSAAVVAVVRSVLLLLRRCPQYRKPFCAAL